MIYIALAVIGLIAILIVPSRWTLNHRLLFVFSALIIGTVLTFILINTWSGSDDVISKGGQSSRQVTVWEIALYFAMIAGMAAKYLYDAIGEGDAPQLKKWQIVKPFLVSPLVFGVIYTTMDESTSYLLLLIFSFQNGFFWQTVLSKV